MILPDDPTGIEDAVIALCDLATSRSLSETDILAALAQAVGVVYEHARDRGEAHEISAEELKELIDRYTRRGAMISGAVAAAERKRHEN